MELNDNLRSRLESLTKVHVKSSKKLSEVTTSYPANVLKADFINNTQDRLKHLPLVCKVSKEDFKTKLTDLSQTRESFLTTTDVLLVPQSFRYDESDRPVPFIYDFLMVFFQDVNPNEYHKDFRNAYQYYYEAMKDQVRIDVDEYKEYIRKCLPLTKLNMLSYYDETGESEKFLVTLRDVHDYFVCPYFVKEDAYELLENHLGTNIYDLTEYNFLPVGETTGLLGEYFKLNVTVNSSENLKLFIKCLPHSFEELEKTALDSFSKERFMYETFFPKLKQLGYDDLLDVIPKMYYVNSNGVLVFQDLSFAGYKCFNIHESTREYLSLCVKNLAKVHAGSILLEEKSEVKGIYEEYKQYLKETLIYKEHLGFENGAKHVIDYFIDKFDDVHPKISADRFKEIVRNTYDSLYEAVKGPTGLKSVICHGDLWAGNILVDNDLNSCYFVDFQLIRYSPPTLDLFFLIYINSRKMLRDDHLEELKEEYYKALSGILDQHGVDSKEIYTREEFLKSCEFTEPMAICMALSYYQLHVPDDVSPFVSEDRRVLKRFYSHDRSDVFDSALEYTGFRQRIRGYIEDLYRTTVDK